MVFFAELPKHYKDEIKDPLNIVIRIQKAIGFMSSSSIRVF